MKPEPDFTWLLEIPGLMEVDNETIREYHSIALGTAGQ